MNDFLPSLKKGSVPMTILCQDFQVRRINQWEELFNKYSKIKTSGEVFDVDLNSWKTETIHEHQDDLSRELDEFWVQEKNKFIDVSRSGNLDKTLARSIRCECLHNSDSERSFRERPATLKRHKPHFRRTSSAHSSLARKLNRSLKANSAQKKETVILCKRNIESSDKSGISNRATDVPSLLYTSHCYVESDSSSEEDSLFETDATSSGNIGLKGAFYSNQKSETNNSGNDDSVASMLVEQETPLHRLSPVDSLSRTSRHKSPPKKVIFPLGSPVPLVGQNGSCNSPAASRPSRHHEIARSRSVSPSKRQIEKLSVAPKTPLNTSGLGCHLEKLHLHHESPRTSRHHGEKLTLSPESPQTLSLKQHSMLLHSSSKISRRRIEKPTRLLNVSFNNSEARHREKPELQPAIAKSPNYDKTLDESLRRPDLNWRRETSASGRFPYDDSARRCLTRDTNSSTKTTGRRITLDSAELRIETESGKKARVSTNRKSLFQV